MSSVSVHYLETFIISEIVKSYNARGEEVNITYYGDKDKNKIDLIFFRNNKVFSFKNTEDSNAKYFNDKNIL